jgi:HTH-type transcriptional regulator/antitoxin HipB
LTKSPFGDKAEAVRARTPVDVGLMIRARRKQLELDQRTLAERIGVSRQWLVEVEKGKPRAELGLVLRALTALGLDVDISAARDSKLEIAAPKSGAQGVVKARPARFPGTDLNQHLRRLAEKP